MRLARAEDLAAMILESDKPIVLAEALDRLARAADTADLLLRKDFPGEAASLRGHVAQARYLLARINQETKMAEWQPIETAPKHYTPIILGQDEVAGEGWYASHLACWEFASATHTMKRHPTLWMPLPKTPSEVR